MLVLFDLFFLSFEESLFLLACFLPVGLAERERPLFEFVVGDWDRDVFGLGFFFFNEALVRPLCDEFFAG